MPQVAIEEFEVMIKNQLAQLTSHMQSWI